MTDRPTTPMDTPHGRVEVPAAPHRLHGADRSGLGEKGWAEVPEDQVGHPDDTNVDPEFFEPAPNAGDAHVDANRPEQPQVPRV